MSAMEKSDLPEVAEKRANKAALAAAEPVEQRGGAKENAELQSTVRTQSRAAVSHEGNLSDLHSRVQTGAYRALPSRRTYIPKADGRQRPLGIAALEDKIVQAAVVAILTPIYEAEFLGFSYGFRPKRNQHQALDALAFGIGHWSGHPSGPSGVVLAMLFGAWLGKAMLETRGLLVPAAIHGVADALIYGFLAAGGT